MRRWQPHLRGQAAHDLERAGDGVAALGRPAAVTRDAVDRYGDVDTAAIAEADAVAGAVEYRHVGAHAGGFDDAANGVMPSGFAGDATQKHQPAAKRRAALRDRLHGDKNRGERRFLFAQTLAENDLARQPIRLRRRGLRRHKDWAWSRPADSSRWSPASASGRFRRGPMSPQIAHGVAPNIGDAQLTEAAVRPRYR